MTRNIILVIILTTIQVNFVFAFNNNVLSINKSRIGYSDSLNILVTILLQDKTPNNKLLLFCIPSDSTEAFTFFNLDYRKEKKYNQAFTKINGIWLEKCMQSRQEFLIKYFEYSQFVDGYFAEAYFDNIEEMIKKIGDNFCKALINCEKNKIKRILKDEVVSKSCINSK